MKKLSGLRAYPQTLIGQLILAIIYWIERDSEPEGLICQKE
jgi:hypothetical protein